MASPSPSPNPWIPGESLAAAQVAELRGLLFGDRVKRLRLWADWTQDALRDRLSQKVSSGWLSGVENNNIPVAPDRRSMLAEAFGLVASDRELLLSEESLGQHPETAYAAWQAVRLFLADHLASQDGLGDRDDLARARRARDRIRAALQDDPVRRAGPGGMVGGLTHYQTLPVATRWMLVVEAAFMDPFAPFSPADWYDKVIPKGMTEKVHIKIETALIRIAEELGLADEQCDASYDKLAEEIASARRHRKYTDRKRLRPQPGVEAAFIQLGDETASARIVRGADEVGWLGWWAACGMFLVRNNWGTQDAGQLGVASSARIPWGQMSRGGLSQMAAVLLGGSALGLTTAVGVAAARAAERGAQTGLEPVDPRAEAIRQSSYFLEALGAERMQQDLARLVTFYKIESMGRAAALTPSNDEPVPSLSEASQDLSEQALALDEVHKELKPTERSSSPILRRLIDIKKQLESASAELSKLTAD